MDPTKSYFSLLPKELVFNVIKYLNFRREITQLIRSDHSLTELFSDDNVWRQMLYQNITDITIPHREDTWRDIYMDNKDVIIKYNMNVYDERYIYDRILITADDFIDTLPYDNIKALLGDFSEGFIVSFINSKKFKYDNPDDMNFSTKMKSLIAKDFDQAICFINTADEHHSYLIACGESFNSRYCTFYMNGLHGLHVVR